MNILAGSTTRHEAGQTAPDADVGQDAASSGPCRAWSYHCIHDGLTAREPYRAD